MTGAGDHELRFWDFEMVATPPAPDATGTVAPTADGDSDDEEEKPPAPPPPATLPQRLALVHTRTLKLNDDVLCVAYTPDMRYVCAGLLDSTIQVCCEGRGMCGAKNAAANARVLRPVDRPLCFARPFPTRRVA